MSYGTQGENPSFRDGSSHIKPITPASDYASSPISSTEDGDYNESCEGSTHQRREEEEGGATYRERILRNANEFYNRNFGLLLVFAAQTFGSVMSTAAKLLTSKDSPNRFHALHIIFVRMLVTSILGLLYMWYKSVPSAPFGPRNVVGLLIMRGSSGFIGLFGLYYSLSYLEISDATAISFLVPTWTAILCYIWLKEPYRAHEALSGVIALAGVLLIARPAFLFGSPAVTTPDKGNNATSTSAFIITAVDRYDSLPIGSPSSQQRMIAVLCSIIGTLAAATAYSTIRVIGKRAHSLISVNYFAMLSTMGSAVIIAVHPDLQFILPKGALQWSLMMVIGVAGFLLQFLLTEGLQREKGGRATNMTYFQMVIVLVIERVIWGTTPAALSLVGSAMIIGASIWLSLQKSKPTEVKARTAVVDEETSLLGPGREQPRA